MNYSEMYLEAQDLNQQAALLIKTGKFDVAKEKIEKAIEIEPMLMDSYKNYGDLSMALHQYKEAKNYYKKALLIEKNGLLYFLFGNACFMNDEMDEGLENYNLAISNGYDNDEMLFFMGMAYEHLNDDQMALRYFKKASLKNPSKPDYQVKKISVMLRLDMIDAAEESVDELIQNSPELYDGYHIKTQILLYKKQIKEAVKFSKGASERFPEDVDLLFDYIKCVANSNNLELAAKLIHTAKQMKYFEESKPQFLLLEAQIAAEQQNIATAIECCEECLKLEQEDQYFADVRFMLLNMYLLNKNFEQTYQQAEQIVNKNRKDLYYYTALYYRPYCLKQNGKLEEAKRMFKEVNSIYRLYTLENPEAIDIYLYRVMCLKELEMYDKALEILEFVETVTREVAEIYTLRAEIFEALGKHTQSKEALNKAYDLKPELKPANEEVGV